MHGGGEAEINLTPLLDVVLQLIMFFMITVGFVSEQVRGDIKLPIAQRLVVNEDEAKKRQAIKDTVEEIILNLDKENNIIGRQELPIGKGMQTRSAIQVFLERQVSKLEREYREKRKPKPKIVLVLRADEEARYSKVFDIMEAGRMAKIENLQIRGMQVAGEKKKK
jgi:biopolymer transport protein ExbD